LCWALPCSGGIAVGRLSSAAPSRAGIAEAHCAPLLVAFSTTSSEAVFPKLTEELERFGCKTKS